MGNRNNAGRVLSARNEQRIRDAQDALAAVLAELPAADDDTQEGNTMAKPIIDLSALSATARNRAPQALGPGHVRVAASTEEADTADVWIYGDIGGWWDGVQAEDFAKEIAALDVSTLNVRLNSPGGAVFDGTAIYNALAAHPARVIVHIDGIAASIASIIAMAGDEIRISEGASMMIHKPWSLAIGDAEAMRKEADVLDGLQEGLVDIYAARTGADRADIQAWVNAETWFRGQKAVDEGFADVLVPAKKKEDKKAARAHARSAMLPLFRNAPQDLLDAGGDDASASNEVRILERQLRDVVGLSAADAKCAIALAKAALHTGPRDEIREPAAAAAPAPAAAPPAPRDEGATELQRLAAFLKALPSA
ncbi:head maturation protease, ClpP-related [Azohydromonas aeria]|uniref:head maturation protease, ClpP-related n=1 Tax=Azohydromonas aeria TaxID=2590212 RepID=UPI0018DF4573|nr:head maturation protease, ClpP-related [Azohydromonas aeria]